MGRNSIIVVVVLVLFSLNGLGQELSDCLEFKPFEIHDARLDSFIYLYQREIVKLDGSLNDVKTSIVERSGFSDAVGTKHCVLISTRLLQLVLGNLALVNDSTEISAVSRNQLLAVFVGIFTHEFGHAMQATYGLPKEFGDISDAAERQIVREYHADFLAGYLGAKSLWMLNRREMEKTCATSKIDIAIFAVDIYLNNVSEIDKKMACLDKFLEPYRISSFFESRAGSSDHGLPVYRRRSFDAGIYFAMVDGIAKDTLPDREVGDRIVDVLRYLGISLDQFKAQVITNLKAYFEQRRGFNVLSLETKAYPLRDAYRLGFYYICQSPRK